jgi:TRAP transporter TAXI family solute receptor
MLAVSRLDDQDNVSRPNRRRTSTSLIVLVAGIAIFTAAAASLVYALRPVTLRIAVGPAGSEDEKLVTAIAQSFADGRALRLVPTVVEASEQGLALLTSSKVDLAVVRADLAVSGNAETVVVVRKDFVTLWSPAGVPAKDAKTRPSKIGDIAGLAGRRIGIIGQTPANVELLKVILTGSGVAPDKVAVTQFSASQIEELARDPAVDAFMAVGPLDSGVAAQAIAATLRSRGEPKFLPIEASEAIALKNPRYASEEIPLGVFNSSPARPKDKVETLSVEHLIVARKTLSETTVAAFARQLFAVRQSLARKVGTARVQKPDTDKDAELPVHRGAAAFFDGNERTFFDKYGDYFWFALLALSGLGSAAAWLRHFLKRDEREGTTLHRARIMAMIPKVRDVQSAEGLPAMQREVDGIIREAVECYDDGAIDEGDLAAFGLVLELFHHAVAEKGAEINGSGPQAVCRVS